MPIKVAITDDHVLLIKGIEDALLSDPSITITGTYASAAAVLSDLSHNRPDVLLLDVQLPDNEGTTLAQKIRTEFPDIRILLLTAVDSSALIKEFLQLGCMGYLLKSNTGRQILVQAVHDVFNDRIFLDPLLKDQLLQNIIQEGRTPLIKNNKLTKRELEILKLIIAELSNQEIAAQLYLSTRTVENHRFNIHQKLGAKNTVGLVKIAMQMGLI